MSHHERRRNARVRPHAADHVRFLDVFGVAMHDIRARRELRAVRKNVTHPASVELEQRSGGRRCSEQAGLGAGMMPGLQQVLLVERVEDARADIPAEHHRA